MPSLLDSYITLWGHLYDLPYVWEALEIWPRLGSGESLPA